jgi:hypothetical protein
LFCSLIRDAAHFTVQIALPGSCGRARSPQLLEEAFRSFSFKFCFCPDGLKPSQRVARYGDGPCVSVFVSLLIVLTFLGLQLCGVAQIEAPFRTPPARRSSAHRPRRSGARGPHPSRISPSPSGSAVTCSASGICGPDRHSRQRLHLLRLSLDAFAGARGRNVGEGSISCRGISL